MSPRSQPEQLIERLEASDLARERTKVILLTLFGDWEVKHALARLGISRTRFQVLRERLLAGAVAALEPASIGRPRTTRRRSARERQLGHELELLRLEARRLRARLRIAEGPLADAVSRRLASRAAQMRADRRRR